MTAAADPEGEAPVESVVVDAKGVPMSALVLEAPRPRAVVVALHGGAMSSGYFDPPGRPWLSLLRTAYALGHTVIALDRPGYGASASYGHEVVDPVRRTEVAYAALDALLEIRQSGAGVFVLAHSVGCDLALRMAAHERGAELLGLEFGGTGRHNHPHAARVREARKRGLSGPPGPRGTGAARGTGLRDILWGPGSLYPPEVDAGAAVAAPLPPYEPPDARLWAGELPGLAAGARVPVHYTLGDHERWWRNDAPDMAAVAALFTASPRVVTHRQRDGGHNLSFGWSARAYHLNVLAFAEECVIDRDNGG